MTKKTDGIANESRISRRRFLAKAGAGTAAAAFSPAFLQGRSNKSGSRMVLGSGAYEYELVPGWNQLPNGVKYGYTHGVQIDSHNRVIIHNQSKDSVMVATSRTVVTLRPAAHGQVLLAGLLVGELELKLAERLWEGRARHPPTLQVVVT